MTLVLRTLNEGGSPTDERMLRRGDDHSICFAALATSCVVDGVTHELVDGKRLSGDRRLVDCNEGVAGLDVEIFFVIALVSRTLLFILTATWFIVVTELVRVLQLLVFFEVFGAVVVAN